MFDCFQVVNRNFRAGEMIYDFCGSGDAVGVVERGKALLIRIDIAGVSTVMEELGPGGVFGRTLAFDGNREDSLQVVCSIPCEILFIDYPHILKRCEKACTHHSMLVQNMLRLMADKAQILSERVDVLSRRTIRDKLLCYFGQLADRAGGPTFRLPFSLSTLADYIATDRSAMMRELKRLREEGVLSTESRQITLLKEV
jgi:CRP-like cAMP-binding protein